jgi:hypothetical protein
MARNIAVGVGIMEYPFQTVDGFWRWVDLCEQGGLDSIWQTDRLVSRTPFLECMTMLAAVAGRTRRIKFGVNVVSVAMREPVLLAKQCATVDVLSAGRLLPGFGIGSPRGGEWAAMHLDSTTRGRKTDEALEIISRLWAGESLTFEGRHFRLTDASIAPVPVQPDLPMWIGGSSDAAIRRTAKLGTGWQAGAETPEAVGAVIAGINRRRPLRRGLRSPVRRTGRPGGRQGDGALQGANRPRPRRSVCDGRCRGDSEPAARLHRSRRVEVHPAPHRGRRCRHAGADEAADRGGVAGRGPALAEGAEGRGLNATILHARSQS